MCVRNAGSYRNKPYYFVYINREIDTKGEGMDYTEIFYEMEYIAIIQTIILILILWRVW